MITRVPAGSTGVVHAALLYRGEGAYLDTVLPFVAEGLAKSESVLIALPQKSLALVRQALGDAADEVTMADITEIGRNPGRILGWQAAFAAERADRPVRITTEILWPGRTVEEYPACVQHEALFNMAFAGRDMTALCLYDAEALDTIAAADVGCTHPVLWQSGSMQISPDYQPVAVLDRYNQPLPNSATAVHYTVRTAGDLGPARSFATRYAQWLGLSADGVTNLLLIMTELATNSLQHAGSACRLAFWQHNGNLVCQASDQGRLDDPLAGRRPPPTDDATAGRGLYLVNTIADLVRSHTSVNGTTIQAYLRLDSSKDPIT
ncbi:sensor histidine kinase [Mycobacterium simiae]|uniref:Sensor histidine kinase n=1 Tax=Mycobacterium simiae TaxID=1784 RepID=A0A5B1BLW2_MYCSI|nr:sensor histidine kinase [Mycobacterium simiae]KAA1249446.1 sensor histidine kinase [Mycobacterium simiae]